MRFDAWKDTAPSRRSVCYGKKGMVCASQPLAAQAGLEMLKRGGNAVDAAVAVAICLTVVEPISNGVGSDAFALVWMEGEEAKARGAGCAGKPYGLNSSGPAPMLAEAKKVRELGCEAMPPYGMIPITVPGAPGAWAELSRRFGRLPFETLFEPAIRCASEGFAVTPVIGTIWKQCYEEFSQSFTGAEFQPWFRMFAPKGRAPEIGELWGSEELGSTLRQLAETKCESFYRGELAERIDECCAGQGGFLRKADLAAYRPEWVEPISVRYRGYDVWEIPPNGHGIAALMALNILEGFSFPEDSRTSVETYHRQLEAMKLAYVDGKRYVTDPRYMKVSVEQLLSQDYAARRRALIEERALTPEPGRPDQGGTVYFCAADEEGNMVSMIQSGYREFGSGIVVPGTGICLQDRGHNFSLDEESENCLAPGKKPYHTIIPGFLTKSGEAVGPFGVMGGFMQPQGHVQVIMNTLDFHLNPQSALDVPRWQWLEDRRVLVEPSFPAEAVEGLRRLGHRIEVAEDFLTFGRGQIIWKTELGSYAGATEPRADGTIAVW